MNTRKTETKWRVEHRWSELNRWVHDFDCESETDARAWIIYARMKGGRDGMKYRILKVTTTYEELEGVPA